MNDQADEMLIMIPEGIIVILTMQFLYCHNLFSLGLTN